MAQEEERKISFKAQDNGFSAFMQKARTEFAKTKKEAQSIYTMFADEAKKQNLGFRDTKKFIDEQLRALKEQLKVQKELTQEKLKQNKELQAEAIRTGQMGGYKSLQAEETKLEATLDNLVKKRSIAGEVGSLAGSSTAPKRAQGSVFSGVLGAELLREILGLARQVPNAKTGVDLVAPAFQAAGAAGGALLGAVTKGIPGLSSILSSFGSAAGGFFGDAVVRTRMARNEAQQSLYGYSATSGRSLGPRGDIRDMGVFLDDRFGRVGVNSAQALESMSGATRASGGFRRGTREAIDATGLLIGLERGYGVDQGTTQGALGAGRFGGGSGTSNVLRSLGLAVAKGIDQSRFADVVRGQTSLLERWSHASTTVSGDRANQVLFGFNRLGGQFSLGDSRAMGNVGAINDALANPNSPFAQAQSYSVLRRLRPGANAWDLMTSREQGLQTPGYLEGVLKSVDQGTSSNEFKKFQLKGLLGLDNAAIDTLWGGFKRDGSVTDLTRSSLTQMGVENKAAEFTTPLQRQQADIQNSFREGLTKGLESVWESFKIEMGLSGDIIKEAGEEFKQNLLGIRVNWPGLGERSLFRDTKRPSVYGKLGGSGH